MRQFKPGQLQSGSLYPITASNAVTASYVLNALSASYAVSASYEINYETSSSYAETASFATSASYALTASYVTASNVFGPYGSNSIISASYATNALNAQDILVYVQNNSGYNIAKGTVVHITASGNSSDTPRIISASYENDANSANTLGIANESIANGGNGYVMTEGILKGIDTSAFISGQMVYLGASGSIIGYAPQAPLHGVRIGQVVRVQQNNGSVYVRIDNGYELDELHDVRIMTASLQYGDLLMRSGSVWTNSKQLSGSYALTGSLTATSFSGSLFGTASNAVSASIAANANNAGAIDIFSFGAPVESYLLMSNVIATTGVAVGGDADLRYNSSTNTLSAVNISATNITGSLLGTASFATSASRAVSSSFATTASFASTASFVATAQTASYVLNAVSASFATSASRAVTASFATTASHAQTSSIATSASYAPAAGSDTEIQFNSTGNFNSSPGLRYDYVVNSFANGSGTAINGAYSHAEGVNTITNGDYSHAEGSGATTNGAYSHAEGRDTITNGSYSHAEGYVSETRGDYSHAEGNGAKTVGMYSHAEGVFSITGQSAYSCSITNGTVEIDASQGDLTGTYSDGTTIYYGNINNIGTNIFFGIVTGSGFNGTNTTFQLLNDTSTTITSAGIIDANGNLTYQLGGYGAHAEGTSTIAIGDASHAEGESTYAYGASSHAEGGSTTYGNYSHAEGQSTTYGDYSHAEGSAITWGTYSHAEGGGTAGSKAYYSSNIAVGVITLQSYYGDLSAIFTPATKIYIQDGNLAAVLIHEVASSAFNGTQTEVTLVDTTYDPQNAFLVAIQGNVNPTYADTWLGDYSHAEGRNTQTLGSYSHAGGLVTTTHGDYQTVVGQYNAPVQVSSSFVVGNGDSGTPSNLLVAYGNTVQVTGSIGIHNAVSATLTSLSSSFGTTPTSTYSIPVQPNGGAWFEYVIRSGSNARTGTIMAVWDDTLVNFTDTTTTDLGDTSGVTLAVTNDTTNITFDASATTDDWSIKAIIRSI